MSFDGPDGSLNSNAGLYGPGSHYYASNSYGYSDSSESYYGETYTHTHYFSSGVTTDYHSSVYAGSYYYSYDKSVYRSYPSAYQAYTNGYAAPPSNASYGYEVSTYQSASLTDSDIDNHLYQTRSESAYTQFYSGYSVSYVDTGSSEFYQGSFVSGSAINDALETVTNPYGYSTYTPNYRTY